MSNYYQPTQKQIEKKKPKFSAMLQTNAFKKSLANAMQNPKEIQKFTVAITSVVSTNPAIEECDAGSILSAALCGHALGLPPSPQLGQYYLVPFKHKEKKDKFGNIIEPAGTSATFVLGYRGYLQLAIRSGQYKKINVLEIKEGELIKWDPLTEEISIKMIEDETERENAETVGYYAYFRYTNGFEKALYWNKNKMVQHAKKYSSGYVNDIKKGTNYTFWAKDFDSMAKKTMLRQLISKWGVMSVDMQTAYEADNHVIKDDGNPDYDMVDVEVSNNENEYEQTNFEQTSPEPAQQVTEEQFSIDDLAE